MPSCAGFCVVQHDVVPRPAEHDRPGLADQPGADQRDLLAAAFPRARHHASPERVAATGTIACRRRAREAARFHMSAARRQPWHGRTGTPILYATSPYKASMLRLAVPLPSLGAGLPAPVRAALWMTAASSAFAVMIILIRHLSATFDPLQVVFFRNVFGLIAMLPWLAGHGLGALRTRRLGLHALRASIGVVSMICWFTALSLMPLAQATALSFTAPIFASVLAVIFLGEVMRLRRWSATAAGLLGTLVILRPDGSSLEPAALLALASALLGALSPIFVKVMARSESTGAIVTYMVLFTTPLSLVPALFVWQAPSLAQLGFAALLGLAGTLGHLCLTRALATADATVVVPFDYLRLPIVALLAWLAFAEVPVIWTWIGGAIIAASSLYMTLREVRLKRQAQGPGPGAPGEAGLAGVGAVAPGEEPPAGAPAQGAGAPGNSEPPAMREKVS
jgi:drug/metabolite transporter (DMT)-like permease